MLTTEEQATVATLSSEPVISWGAIFAGLTFIVAGSLLLTLLGAAIGVSIIDVTDMDALGGGLATGAAVWVLLTALVVNFVGGLLAAHLSGRMTHASGLMHGVVVWGVGLLAMLMIDSMAVRAMVQAGTAVTQGAASVTSSLGGAVFSGVRILGGGVSELATSSYTEELRARLRREAAKVLAESQASGGPAISEADIRQAMNNIDEQLLENVLQKILSGDTDGARRTLRQELGLSAAEVDDLVEGVSQRIQSAASDSEAVQQAGAWLNEQLDDAMARLARMSGPGVNRQELRDALQQLDTATSMTAAKALLAGDTVRAKTTIAANTDLSETEVNAIVDGVSESIANQGDDLLERFNSTVESVSTYVQAVLWLYFFAASLSLGAAAVGGYVGASGTSRRYASVSRRTSVS